MQIRAGEKFVCVAPAGGGMGPASRAPGGCATISPTGRVEEVAKCDYGVVLSAGIVDEAATARLRGEMVDCIHGTAIRPRAFAQPQSLGSEDLPGLYG